MWWRITLGLALFSGLLKGQQLLQVSDGIRYEHRTDTESPLSIHLVQVDPKRNRLLAARALNSGIGRETVSSIAKRRGALVAINGGFFAMGGRYDGDPVGPLRIENRWFSDSSLGRGAIGWNPDGQVAIDRITVRWYLEVDGIRYFFKGLNEQRRAPDAVLYNWHFHRSTLTDPGGIEWLISDGIVTSVTARGDSPIPIDGYVASFGPAADMKQIQSIEPGTPIQLGALITAARAGSEQWETLTDIVGGTPVLISAGAPLNDFASEKIQQSFVEDRHPRTAVCIQKDQTWLLVVVDGRQPNLSRGMSLAELTEFLLAEGCQEALNLDGGGSSTLVIAGELKNSPSDFGVERPVSDAIVVLTEEGARNPKP